MALNLNLKSCMTFAAVAFVTILIVGALQKKDAGQSELYQFANQLKQASESGSKADASLLFEPLTALKYKYADSNNTTCLALVQQLLDAADEVNTGGKWENPDITYNSIQECKTSG